MTERGESSVQRQETFFRIGNSRLNWNNGTLVINVDERAAPIPRPIRGQIRVHTEGLGNATFFIDDAGRHRWRPLSPHTRVEVELTEPHLRWAGHGYLDSNHGEEPLEDAFAFWDWSRAPIDNDRTMILYNTDMLNGASQLSALVADRHGQIEEVESPPEVELPSTPIFRIPRRTRADEGSTPKIVQTLENAPFYSRSLIETSLAGAKRQGIHESLAGPNLNKRSVQFMLPFRMPRRP